MKPAKQHQRPLLQLLVQIAAADLLIGPEEERVLQLILTELGEGEVSSSELDGWLAAPQPLASDVRLPAELRSWFTDQARRIIRADARIEPIELHALRGLLERHFEPDESGSSRPSAPGQQALA